MVVDPPFITREVWSKYAKAIRSALKPNGGLVMLTTVGENEAMLRHELGDALGRTLRKTPFMPAMPHPTLPYQYSLFVNYEPAPQSPLLRWNDEVDDDFRASNEQRMPDLDDSTAQTRTTAVPAAYNDKPIAGTQLSFDELLARERRAEGR